MPSIQIGSELPRYILRPGCYCIQGRRRHRIKTLRLDTSSAWGHTDYIFKSCWSEPLPNISYSWSFLPGNIVLGRIRSYHGCTILTKVRGINRPCEVRVPCRIAPRQAQTNTNLLDRASRPANHERRTIRSLNSPDSSLDSSYCR